MLKGSEERIMREAAAKFDPERAGECSRQSRSALGRQVQGGEAAEAIAGRRLPDRIPDRGGVRRRHGHAGLVLVASAAAHDAGSGDAWRR
jgi:hypothetical protein